MTPFRSELPRNTRVIRTVGMTLSTPWPVGHCQKRSFSTPKASNQCFTNTSKVKYHMFFPTSHTFYWCFAGFDFKVSLKHPSNSATNARQRRLWLSSHLASPANHFFLGEGEVLNPQTQKTLFKTNLMFHSFSVATFYILASAWLCFLAIYCYIWWWFIILHCIYISTY